MHLSGGGANLSNRAQHFAAMPDPNTNVLEILLGQIAQDAYGVDPVIGKALGVLGHGERGQPLRDRGHPLPSQFHHRGWHRATMRTRFGFAIPGDPKAD